MAKMMLKRILLISGWGVGPEVLANFVDALRQQQFQVTLINIFNPDDPVEHKQYVELAQQYDVLMGWSLGGQLASVLANAVWQLTGEAKILITLASNPCFVQNEYWQKAMPRTAFLAFQQSYIDDANACIKRFSYLICQGTPQVKQDWLTLQSLMKRQDFAQMKQGLETLSQLNTVEILQNYVGQQFHFLAQQDQLLTPQIATYLRNLAAKFLKIILVDGSHAFPVTNPEPSAEQIVQICQQL